MHRKIPHIVFRERDHAYFRTSDSFRYTSVTKVVELYKEKYDEDFWLTYKAGESLMENFWDYQQLVHTDKNKLKSIILKNVDPYKLEDFKTFLKQDWKEKKDESTDKGTSIHNKKEVLSLERGFEINPITKKKFEVFVKKVSKNWANYTIAKDLIKLPTNFYPELLVYNDYFGVCGQSDKVFVEELSGLKFVDIGDYKTNANCLKKESFTNPITGKKQMMLNPINHIMDVEWWHYTLQISLYAYMMELFGFIVRNLYIQYQPSLKYKRVLKIMYLREEAKLVLEHFLQNR